MPSMLRATPMLEAKHFHMNSRRRGPRRHLSGTVDAFVTKLDSTGATILYSTYLGARCEEGLALPSMPRATTMWQAIQKHHQTPDDAGSLDVTFNGFHDVFVTNSIVRLHPSLLDVSRRQRRFR